MNEERVGEMLVAYADGLIDRSEAMEQIDATGEERRRLAALFQLTERLQQNMQPIQPSADFVRSLGQELVNQARRQIQLSNRLRRAALIGAAALGSLLSIASVVGAILFVVARLRARAQTGAIHAPTA